MTKSWNDLADLQSPDYDAYSNLLLIDANNFLTDGYKDLTILPLVTTLFALFNPYQNLTKLKRTVVCFDFGKSYYRMDMLDEYKGTRKKPQDEEEAKKYEEFFAVLNDLPDQLDEEVLKFRGVEADDILAYMVKKYEQTEDYDHIWIVSSDRDLYQLVSEKTSIFNIFGRREITNGSMNEDMDIT